MEDTKQENLSNELDGRYLDSWDGHSFSFMDLLDVSSVYDFIAGNLMTDEECGAALQKKNGSQMPRVRPHIAIVDLNNTKDDPYVNRPKRAIEIGIKGEF